MVKVLQLTILATFLFSTSFADDVEKTAKGKTGGGGLMSTMPPLGNSLTYQTLDFSVKVIKSTEEDSLKIKKIIREASGGISKCLDGRRGKFKVVWRVSDDHHLYDIQITNIGATVETKEVLSCIGNQMKNIIIISSGAPKDLVVCEIEFAIK